MKRKEKRGSHGNPFDEATARTLPSTTILAATGDILGPSAAAFKQEEFSSWLTGAFGLFAPSGFLF